MSTKPLSARIDCMLATLRTLQGVLGATGTTVTIEFPPTPEAEDPEGGAPVYISLGGYRLLGENGYEMLVRYRTRLENELRAEQEKEVSLLRQLDTCRAEQARAMRACTDFYEHSEPKPPNAG